MGYDTVPGTYDAAVDGDYETLSSEDLLNITQSVIRKDGRGWVSYPATQAGIEDAYSEIQESSPGVGDNSGTIMLPPETAIEISSTLDLATLSPRGFGFIGDFGVASSKDPPTAYLDSTISDGSNVLEISARDAFEFKGITVTGSGNDGDGINLGFGGADAFNCHMLGVHGVGGAGISGTVGDGELRDSMVSNVSGIGIDSVGNLTRCEVEQTGGWGIRVEGGYEIKGCIAEGAATGFLFASPKIRAVNCSTQTGNDGWGYRLNCSNPDGPITMQSCSTNGSNGNGAVEVNKATDVLITNCDFNSDSGVHIRITSNAARIAVVGTALSGSVSEFNIDAGATDIYVGQEVGSTLINGENNVDIAAGNGSGTWDGNNNEYTVSFDTDFSHHPEMNDLADVEITGHSFNDTDSDGDFEEVVVSFASAPSYYSWHAKPRNVRL